MKRRWRVILIAAAGAIGLLAALVRWFPKEPVYQGKPISFWIQELGRTQPMRIWESDRPAKEAVRTLGTNAVPYLAKAMRRRSTSGEWYRQLWPKLPGIIRDRLPHPVYPGAVRREAATMLAELIGRHRAAGTDQVVSALIDAVRDPQSDLRIIAIGVLGTLAAQYKNQTALAALIDALDSPEPSVRYHAANQLCSTGPEAGAALPLLTKCMSDTNTGVRVNAAMAVYRISGQSDEPVRILVEAMKADSPTDRGNSAAHLSQIGPAAKPAVPALRQLFRDPDQYASSWASEALKKIDPDSIREETPGLDKMISRATDPDSPKFWEALEQLKQIGPEAKAAVPALIAALQKGVRGRMVELDSSWVVARALLRIDPSQAPVVVQSMVKSLRTVGLGNRNMCAVLLGELGPKAISTVPDLVTALADKEAGVRQCSAFSLFQIGALDDPIKGQALSVLIEALRPARDVHARRLAAYQLGELGAQAKATLQSLTEVLNDEDEELRKKAADALKKIDSETARKAAVK